MEFIRKEKLHISTYSKEKPEDGRYRPKHVVFPC